MMQHVIPALPSIKAQLRGIETVMSIVFIMIILILIGSVLFKGSLKEKQQEIRDKELAYLTDTVENFIRLPELRCSYFGKFCIDVWKAKAVNALAKEPDYWNSLRKRIGAAVIFKLVPLFPDTKSGFVFINTTLPNTNYSVIYQLRLPVAIENDTQLPKVGFGYVEVKAYLK